MLDERTIRAAAARRTSLCDAADGDLSTEIYRLFHGHMDGDDDINIDRYGSVAILEHKRLLNASEVELLASLLPALGLKSLLLKSHRSLDLSLPQRFKVLGQPIPDSFTASEYGTRYELRPFHQHNAGLFLDTRPLRQYLASNAQDAKVLNLFAYTGSLGLSCLKGGAAQVIHADKSREACEWTANNYRHNDSLLDDRDYAVGDLYKNLPKMVRKASGIVKKQYDLIILDPPPKVYTSNRSGPKPLQQDFGRLVEYCAQLLRPRARLICLFHRFGKTQEAFNKEVIGAAMRQQIELCEQFRMTSGDDFVEKRDEDRLKISVFERA